MVLEVDYSTDVRVWKLPLDGALEDLVRGALEDLVRGALEDAGAGGALREVLVLLLDEVDALAGEALPSRGVARRPRRSGPFPGVSPEPRRDLLEGPLNRGAEIPRSPGDQERLKIGKEHRILEFSREIRFQFRSGNAATLRREVLAKTVDDAIEVDFDLPRSPPEIEEIPALLALVQSAELRPEQLVQGVRRNPGRAREPTGFDAKALVSQFQHVEVLP